MAYLTAEQLRKVRYDFKCLHGIKPPKSNVKNNQKIFSYDTFDNLTPGQKFIIKNDFSNVKLRPKENIKDVFEEMLANYMAKHKYTSPKKPTYNEIAEQTGVLTDTKLSNILNEKVIADRMELSLICHVLNANEELTNRFYISAGQATGILSLEEARMTCSLDELTISEMLKLRSIEDLPPIGVGDRAIECYFEIKREIPIEYAIVEN